MVYGRGRLASLSFGPLLVLLHVPLAGRSGAFTARPYYLCIHWLPLDPRTQRRRRIVDKIYLSYRCVDSGMELSTIASSDRRNNVNANSKPTTYRTSARLSIARQPSFTPSMQAEAYRPMPEAPKLLPPPWPYAPTMGPPPLGPHPHVARQTGGLATSAGRASGALVSRRTTSGTTCGDCGPSMGAGATRPAPREPSPCARGA